MAASEDRQSQQFTTGGFGLYALPQSEESTLLTEIIRDQLAPYSESNWWKPKPVPPKVTETTAQRAFRHIPVDNISPVVFWIYLLLWTTLFISILVQWKQYPGYRLGIWWFLGLFAASLALRLLFAIPSPGKPAISYYLYGPSHPVLLSLWSLVNGPTLEQTILTSQVAGALAPAFLATAIFTLNDNRKLAVVTGAFLSIQPLLIRFASELERQSFVLLLASVALWGLARYQKTRSASAFATFAVAMWLCLQCRPEAIALVPMSLALIWPGTPWRRSSLWPMLASMALGLLASVPTLMVMSPTDLTINPKSIPAIVCFWPTALPSALWYLAFIGLALGVIKRERTVLWALLAFGVTELVALSYCHEPHLHLLRFKTLAFIPMTYLAAFGFVRGLSLIGPRAIRMTATFLVSTLIILTCIGPFRSILTPYTLDLEFQFLVRTIPTLPKNALVLHPLSPQDLEYRSYEELSAILKRRDLRWQSWPPNDFDVDGPVFFYQGSLCNVAPMSSADEISDYIQVREEQRNLTKQCREGLQYQSAPPIAQTSLPARPYFEEQYFLPNVRVAFIPIDKIKAQGEGH